MTKARTIGLVIIIAIALGPQTGAQGTTVGSRTDRQASTSTGWTKKTSWGDPDLQAIWNDSTATPMQRNPKYGTRATFTDEEYAGILAAAEKVARQRRSEADGQARGLEGGNSIWVEVGKPLRQTSLII